MTDRPEGKKPYALLLAMLVPLALIAIVGAIVYAIGRLLGG